MRQNPPRPGEKNRIRHFLRAGLALAGALGAGALAVALLTGILPATEAVRWSAGIAAALTGAGLAGLATQILMPAGDRTPGAPVNLNLSMSESAGTEGDGSHTLKMTLTENAGDENNVPQIVDVTLIGTPGEDGAPRAMRIMVAEKPGEPPGNTSSPAMRNSATRAAISRCASSRTPSRNPRTERTANAKAARPRP